MNSNLAFTFFVGIRFSFCCVLKPFFINAIIILSIWWKRLSIYVYGKLYFALTLSFGQVPLPSFGSQFSALNITSMKSFLVSARTKLQYKFAHLGRCFYYLSTIITWNLLLLSPIHPLLFLSSLSQLSRIVPRIQWIHPLLIHSLSASFFNSPPPSCLHRRSV